jgi:hypothetical protein
MDAGRETYAKARQARQTFIVGDVARAHTATQAGFTPLRHTAD